MQRIVIYLKRRADLTRSVFFDWWLGHHSALATQLPGLRRHIISLVADEQEGLFDGMAELWFDDLAAAEAAFASTAGRPAAEARQVLVSRRFKDAVDADWQRARQLGVTGVPTFVAQGRGVVGAQPYEVLERLVVLAGAQRRDAQAPSR